VPRRRAPGNERASARPRVSVALLPEVHRDTLQEMPSMYGARLLSSVRRQLHLRLGCHTNLGDARELNGDGYIGRAGIPDDREMQVRPG
jgi:hypothetical protein